MTCGHAPKSALPLVQLRTNRVDRLTNEDGDKVGNNEDKDKLGNDDVEIVPPPEAPAPQ